jgi:F0F1-type ATP synthase membrane subunit b/b'
MSSQLSVQEAIANAKKEAQALQDQIKKYKDATNDASRKSQTFFNGHFS